MTRRRCYEIPSKPMVIGASLMIAMPLAAVQSAQAADPQRQATQTETLDLRYSLTFLSVPLGSLDYGATFGRTRYNADMHFRTSGLAALLWKSEIDASAEGRTAPQALLPDHYASRSLSRHGTRQSLRVNYATGGAPVMVADPPYDLSRSPVTDAQKQGAIDPVTAISA